jgi:hypothetical protein
MHAAVCPACQRRVKLPENTTGRTVNTMCPKCGELLPVPPGDSHHHEEEVAAHITGGTSTATLTAQELRKEFAEATASSKSLGLLVLGLGLVALMTLPIGCISFMDYLGLAVGGVGLVLGIYGLFRGMIHRERDTLYVLAGVAVCVLSVGLLLTRLFFSAPEQSPNLQHQHNILEERNREESKIK